MSFVLGLALGLGLGLMFFCRCLLALPYGRATQRQNELCILTAKRKTSEP